MLDTFENDMILSAVQQLTTEVQRVEGKANKIPVNPEIPIPAIADDGKVLGVDEEGKYTLVEASGGSIYGPDAEKVYDRDFTINLKTDTTWDNWTPSSTLQEIKPAFQIAELNNLDAQNYSYWIRVQYLCDLKYTGTQPYASISKSGFFSVSNLSMKKVLFTEPSYNSVTQGYLSDSQILYKNSIGTTAYGTSTSYGVYPGSAQLSSINAQVYDSGTMKMTINFPRICARCSSNYFDTSSASNVDSENSNLKIKIEVYKVPHEKHFVQVNYDEIIDFLTEE